VSGSGVATAGKAGYHRVMYLDVVDLRAFYSERLGQVARRLIAERVRMRWPSVAGESVLGIGYATPYLADLTAEAERILAFMPAAQGVVNWPPGGPNAAALVADDCLPLPDEQEHRLLSEQVPEPPAAR
jgi:hypothetical protein